MAKKKTNESEENNKLRLMEAKLEAEEEEEELKEEKNKNMLEKKKEKKGKVKEDNKGIIKENKEIIYIIGGLAVLVVVFIAFYFIFRNIGRIEYEGMYFVKEKLGNVTLYHHNFYIKDDVNGKIYSYNLYLRNDPRYNNVKVEADDFSFRLGRPFYLGINSTGLSNCSLSIVAIDTLIQFLMYNNNLIKVKTGSVDAEEADLKNVTYVACNRYLGSTTIILESGDETAITKKGDCYRIKIANCEVTQGVEKFILEALVNARRIKAESIAKSKSMNELQN